MQAGNLVARYRRLGAEKSAWQGDDTDKPHTFNFDEPKFVGRYVDHAINEINKKRNGFLLPESDRKAFIMPAKKWWRGLGQVIIGAGMIGCEFDFIFKNSTHLSPQGIYTSTCSIATGIGMILIGGEELKEAQIEV